MRPAPAASRWMAPAGPGSTGLLDGLDVVDVLDEPVAAGHDADEAVAQRSKAWARPPGMTSRMASSPTPVSSSWAFGNT